MHLKSGFHLRVASQQRRESRSLRINHLPQQWEGEEDEAQETRSSEIYYNYTLPLSILFGGLKGDMGALCWISETSFFTKNKCSFVIFFQGTLTSHLILLPVFEGHRASGIFLILQMIELHNTAEVSNFPVITQPSGDGTRIYSK